MTTSTRRSGARTRSALLRLVGPSVVLVLAASLAACGSDDGASNATDPEGASGTPSSTASDTPAASGDATRIPATGSAGIAEATLVSATEGGGTASDMAFALDTDLAVQDFVLEMTGSLPDTVAATVAATAQESAGATPYGAVVSIGCEPPLGVAIDAGEAGFQVVPTLPKSSVQCLAPVTYVVVFAAPDA